MTKPYGYLASPYQSVNPHRNALFQVMVFRQMMLDGIVTPFIPLLNHFADIDDEISEEQWIEYDNEIIKATKPQWILRLNSDIATNSTGADAEVELVRKLYLDAVVIVQHDDETWQDALERLYSELERLYV